MFSIYDGRDSFYQWDINRKIIVRDSSIKEVHFCNRTDNCSLVVATYKENELTLANVPNILLQTDWKIRVYGYTEDGYTRYDDCFNVIGRTKPSDYVYTETEVKRYEDLEERIEALEQDTPGGDAVTYTAQEATEEQKAQARVNIGADGASVHAISGVDLYEGDTNVFMITPSEFNAFGGVSVNINDLVLMVDASSKYDMHLFKVSARNDDAEEFPWAEIELIACLKENKEDLIADVIAALPIYNGEVEDL